MNLIETSRLFEKELSAKHYCGIGQNLEYKYKSQSLKNKTVTAVFKKI